MSLKTGGDRSGVVSWFVRRAGLARCTTVAGALGLALAALSPGNYAVAIAGLTLALAGIPAGHISGRWRPAGNAALGLTLASVVLMGLFAGLLLGTLRISLLLDGVLASRLGQPVRAEVVVTGPVSARSGWQSATAVVKSIEGAPDAAGAASRARDGAGEKVWLEIAPPRGQAGGASQPALFQGARLAVAGTLTAPQGPSPSGFDQRKQLLHQGIQVVLAVKSAGDVSYLGRRGGVSGWFDRLRESAKAHLSRGPSARVNEVLQGVVMGDTVGIDEGWMLAFRRSGTAHMLSVSGLHVASLAAIMIAIGGFARLSRRAGFVMAAGAALLMVPFVGSSPPIVRSAVMIVVVLVGRWAGRRRDQWQGLAFAALVVLTINPFATFDVGFQLSFSAFAGMVALVRPLERIMSRVPEALRANLAVSVAATLGTAPVSFLVFGRTSLISPLANMLVVPTLASVTGLGMASVLLGYVWDGFSVALDTLASLPMMWTILISTLCAKAPILEAGALGMVAAAAAAAALAVPVGLALAGRQATIPFGLHLPLFARATGWLRRQRPKHRRIAAALGVVTVLLAAVLGATTYPAAAGGLRSVEYLLGGRGWPAQPEVRLLDVGQGTAVLLRTPGRHAALFDAGPAGCDLAAQLRKLGVRRLDLVVISHPHADHFAGLAEAVDSLDVDVLVDRTQIVPAASAGGPAAQAPTGGAEARQYQVMRARLAAKGCRCVVAPSGWVLPFNGATLTFSAPSRALSLLDSADPWGGRAPPTGDELNGGSLVVSLQVDGIRVLLPGDAEADTLERYHLPAVDVLVVGHHGSRGAVSDALLASLRPRLAVISVGKDNTFGHPAPGTMATISATGEATVRTDEAGWVSLRVEDHALAVSTERTLPP